jgi:hypothetical protein
MLIRSIPYGATLVAAALMLTGCGKSDPKAPDAAAAVNTGPRTVLNFGNGTEPQDLDPQIVTGVPENKIVNALFEGLVAEGDGGVHEALGAVEDEHAAGLGGRGAGVGDPAAATVTDRRPGFPRAVPAAWSFAEPCHEPPGAAAPRCEVRVSDTAAIDEAVAWRDVHLRPAADGTTSWRLDGESFLMLGDFPSGSIDSRTWGPLPAAALRYRVQRSR